MDQGQELKRQVDEAAEYIAGIIDHPVDNGIILGTGLGKLAEDVNLEKAIDYADIPNFPVSTVASHAGRLLVGTLMDKTVVVMQGRFHYYEGYTMKQITFPVRVMKSMGVKALVISNVAGGLNPQFQVGDLMLIDDHINLIGDNPLIGINHPDLGVRFLDLSEPYSKELIEIAERIARRNDIKLHRGVYSAMSGPSLETRAEYRFLRRIGADVIGMSSIPENIVANQCSMKVLGVTLISDLCFPDTLKPATIEEIIEAADKAEPLLTTLIKGVIEEL